MTEFEKADINGNGVIEKAEWNKLALEDRRLEMIDRDLKTQCRTQIHRFCPSRYAHLSVYHLACVGVGFRQSSKPNHRHSKRLRHCS